VALRECARRALVAEQRQRVGVWTNENESSIGAQRRKRRVLAEEAVAWMNRVAAVIACGRNDRRGIEIGGSA